MGWSTSNDAFIWIFNVGRGSAAFLRTPLNHGIILDISCNENFSTSEFIVKNLCPYLSTYENRPIAQAILSHPHHDHISDCGSLESRDSKLHPYLLTCPSDRDSRDGFVDWTRIKNIDGNKSLDTYRRLFQNREPGLRTLKYDLQRTTVADLEYGIYYLRPSVCQKLHTNDNEYGNSLSIVTYFRYGNHSILFPGDVTPEAMQRILTESSGVEKRFTIFSRTSQANNPRWTKETFNQPSLKGRLATYGLTVLVAPHHGLESCYSSDLCAAIRSGKPGLVAISEKYAVAEGQGKIHANYQGATASFGMYAKFNGTDKWCNSVTTKSNHILIRMSGTGNPKVFCESKIEDLMKWANA